MPAQIKGLWEAPCPPVTHASTKFKRLWHCWAWPKHTGTINMLLLIIFFKMTLSCVLNKYQKHIFPDIGNQCESFSGILWQRSWWLAERLCNSNALPAAKKNKSKLISWTWEEFWADKGFNLGLSDSRYKVHFNRHGSRCQGRRSAAGRC